MTEAVITADAMRDKLHTLDTVRTALGQTEPLSTHQFSVGDHVRFVIEPGWHHGLDARPGTDLVSAAIQLGRGAGVQQWQLTKDAVLEATSACGINQSYAARCPAELVELQLNYWFKEGLAQHGRNKDYQLLDAAGTGAAITRASIVPFSNLRLLDQALAGIEAKYGAGEVLVDHKFTHTLRRTHLRMIVPEYRRTIERSGTDDDEWSVGIQLKNSIIGAEKTSIDGYLFRWWCLNGAIDTHTTSGVWSRRGGGTEAEVYEWARSAVDEVLGGLEPALDRVQQTTDVRIEGHASDVLRDVFNHYRTPVADRAKIIANMVDTENLTMYALMQAITQVANGADMDPNHVESLLRMGGDIPHVATCGSCFQILP